MSIYPLGPWSKTLANTVEHPGVDGYVKHVSNPPYGSNSIQLSSSTTYSPGLTDVRTGVNSGHKVKVPQNASRNIREQSLVSPVMCSFDWVYQGRKVNSTYVKNSGWYSYSSTGNTAFDALMPAFPSPTVARDKAAAKLIQKLGPALQSLVVAGEFHDTMGTVKRILNTATGYHNGKVAKLNQMARGFRKKDPKAIADLITDLHLEYNFGIKPLISDIDAALKAAEFIGNGSRRSNKLSAKFIDSSSSSSVSNSSGMGFSGKQNIILNSKVVGKVGCSIRPDAIHKPQYETLGLGLRDFVPSVYECLPYSWLLDYVTNIGEFVNLLSLHRGITELGWEVTLVETTRQDSYTPTGSLNGVSGEVMISSQTGVFHCRRFSFNRKPFNLDTFVPDFRFEVPDCRQAANVAALVVQRLLRANVSKGVKNTSRVNALLRRGG